MLLDTGPLVAILAQDDEYHEQCVEQLQRIREPLLTCWPVVTEAAWLLRRYPAAVERMLRLHDGRMFELLAMGLEDAPHISKVLNKYRDLQIQLADAALVWLGEREGIDVVFTLDRRDFGAMRMRGGKRFQMIP